MDILIGDPRNIPHPIRWIGKLIDCLDRKMLGAIPEDEADPEKRDRDAERKKGSLLVLIVIVVTFALSAAVIAAAYLIHPAAGVCAEAVLICYTLARKSLRQESMKVYEKLVCDDLPGAREAVSMIVGRDTDALDEQGVTRAAVETVAENFSDGVMAPMLYNAIGGPVLGLVYKAINTMDSMIGYKNDRYMWLGAAAAGLDDAVNYIPSRISALLLIAASVPAGKDCSASEAYRVWKRDRRNHKSPNAAQTESACAGALGIRLAGDSSYFGRLVKKPYIGDDIRPVEYEDIKRVNRLTGIASTMGWIICLIIMAACL